MIKTGAIASNGKTKQIFKKYAEAEAWLRSLKGNDRFSYVFGVFGYIEEYSITVDDISDKVTDYTMSCTYITTTEDSGLSSKSDEELKDLYDHF